MSVDMTQALNRLSLALKIKTVSQLPGFYDYAALDEYIEYIRNAFPIFSEACELTRVNRYSLNYRWKGKDSAKDPILFMAHYDVVPANDEDGWKYPAFSGEIAEGKVWGRGALDIKSQMTAHFEAVEALSRDGFSPERDIWFSYGFDEEIGGGDGALKAAEHFQSKGIRFAGVIDEGGVVITGAIKGVRSPVALIGVGEKGHVDFKATAHGSGGHSSMPPKSTAIGRIAEFIRRVEKNPMPARLTDTVLKMLRAVSAEMGGAVNAAVKAPKGLRGLVAKVLSGSPETNAMVRTTFAATMIEGGSAPNVLPLTATVNINSRLLTGDSSKAVLEYLKRLAKGLSIDVEMGECAEASPISPDSGEFYGKIEAAAKSLFPEAILAPYLVMGGTDSRHFYKVSQNVYRFTPVSLTNDEKNTMHNINESISVKNYEKMIQFFITLIKGL
jgi:carboxypeptidase PM20D1